MMPLCRRLLVCLAVPAGLLNCSEPKQSPVPDPGRSASPEQEAWGWSTAVTRNGLSKAVVKAEHMVRTGFGEAVMLDGGVTVYFFDSAGADTVSILQSDRARIDAQEDRLVAVGRVVLRSRDSTRLEADSLVWNRRSDLIASPGRVRVLRPDGEETGVGFEATSDLKRWSLSEVVTRHKPADATP